MNFRKKNEFSSENILIKLQPYKKRMKKAQNGLITFLDLPDNWTQRREVNKVKEKPLLLVAE